MARFDVYRHPDAKQRVTTPFLLDVQNEYISGLQTRVVLPLRSAERVAIPLRDLNPALEVEGFQLLSMARRVVMAGWTPVWMAYCSAGRPNASQPIGCSTLKPRIRL